MMIAKNINNKRNNMNEIERRFIIKKPSSQLSAYCNKSKKVIIEQGYIEVPVRGYSLRIRIKNDEKAILTLKGGKGIKRSEDECSVSLEFGKLLMKVCSHRLAKVRYKIGRWEVDFFEQPLDGLVIAEVELKKLKEKVAIPKWFGKVKEVTDSITSHHLARFVTEFDEMGKNTFQPVHIENISNFLTIAITGGPGSGKSTIMEMLKKEYPQLRVIPEIATLVMSQLNIRPKKELNKYFQRLVYNTGTLFESASILYAISEGQFGSVSDRGLPDGAVYFAGGLSEYEKVLRTNIKDEYARYKLVIYLDVPPKDIYNRIKNNNPNRTEDYDIARYRGNITRKVWQDHPNFIFIGNNGGWDEKVKRVREEIDKVLI